MSTFYSILNLLLLHFVGVSYSQSEADYYLFDVAQQSIEQMDSSGETVSSLWNMDSPVKVLIHGWNPLGVPAGIEILKSHFMFMLAEEFGKFNPSLNIILVDWTYLATTFITQYFSAADGTKQAGRDIAEFLHNLAENEIISDFGMVHVLGHSLGAHVAGVVGSEIQKLTDGLDKVGRITGLDPAGPAFIKADAMKLLDKSDAEFVDIIHTSMGGGGILDILLNAAYGSNLQAGHADFYPNGGEQQSYQCNWLTDRLKSCSHYMAIFFYAWSLREPDQFVGCPCDSYRRFKWGYCNCELSDGSGQAMGEDLTMMANGRYYLKIKQQMSELISRADILMARSTIEDLDDIRDMRR